MVSRRLTLSTQVQNALQERIMNGTYAKGEYLPSESSLSEEFGVSRTTVRDAVGALVEKGLLQRQQGKGILVIDRTTDVVMNSLRNMMLRGSYTVAEFLETREMIERQVAYFAALRASKEQIDEMQKTIDRMIASSDDINTYIKYDLEFHRQMAKASQNHLLVTVYDAILPMLGQMIKHVVMAAGTVEENMQYHSKILECVRRGDGDGAQIRTTEHDKCSEQMFLDSIEAKVSLDELIMHI